MNNERYQIALAKFGKYVAKENLHSGSPLSATRFEGAKDGYFRGFGDGVEHILKTSSRLDELETSLKLKDLRLDILEKENERLKLSLVHRKKLHSEAEAELKIVIDRLTLIIGLRDPSLLKQMEQIRKLLE